MTSVMSESVKKRLFTDVCYTGEGYLYDATKCTYRINPLYSRKEDT